MGLKYPRLVYTSQIFLNLLLKGPALVGRYLLIFYGVKVKGSSNAIKVLRYKSKGREISKKRRKEKKASKKILLIAIISISALKTVYYYQLKIPAFFKG